MIAGTMILGGWTSCRVRYAHAPTYTTTRTHADHTRLELVSCIAGSDTGIVWRQSSTCAPKFLTPKPTHKPNAQLNRGRRHRQGERLFGDRTLPAPPSPPVTRPPCSPAAGQRPPAAGAVATTTLARSSMILASVQFHVRISSWFAPRTELNLRRL
jgi:hypothetical protein